MGFSYVYLWWIVGPIRVDSFSTVQWILVGFLTVCGTCICFVADAEDANSELCVKIKVLGGKDGYEIQMKSDDHNW